MTECTVRRYEQLETSPKRSSKICDLPIANTDIFKENYSIDCQPWATVDVMVTVRVSKLLRSD